MRVIISFLLLCMVVYASCQIDEHLLKKHVYYLANDKLKGRAPGTKGEQRAVKYIASHFRKYGLLPKGENEYYQSFSYRQRLNPHDTSQQTGKLRTGTNVIGFIDNASPLTVIIGAHHDHLGTDGEGASLAKKRKKKAIHNGADDNASGVAGVLELARYYATNTRREPVNFLFICFSAEEAGLIGSKYFIQHPTVDLGSIHYMLNMDMVGRLSDSSRRLLIYGIGTSDVFTGAIQRTNHSRFSILTDSSGVGPSDHTSFYRKQIPVLHFFTGPHSDYHKPSDDAHKINYRGLKEILEFIAELTDTLAAKPKLKFYEAERKEDSLKVSFKVTLGIMPDYAFEGKGVRIDGLNKDKPAQKAGLKAGDIIVKIGNFEINNIYDYMRALSNFSKGSQTTVTYRRGSQTFEAQIEF
ncbi:MAG: M20/M25/M40 family metallo-hydrolase [Chitinophagales bacterium]|nr:M20/M25/M40 family metallo-hydrolase [Chitinophagales bacterium]